MDCAKFEPLLLDELYDELDELTSAAVKRHVSGCSRCAGILNGMRATRRVATLPVVELPPGLEERIFAAAKDAQKVIPIHGRAARALSWAGGWAMRPQTAMAAVFLLMIGSSAFLLRGKASSKDAAVSVTVAGEPVEVAAAADHDSLDSKAAAAAHGANAPLAVAPPMVTAAMAAASASPVSPSPAATATALALADDENAGPVDRLTGSKGRDKRDATGAIGALAESAKDEGAAEKKSATRASGSSIAADPAPGNAAAPAGAPDYAPPAQAAAPARKSRDEAQDAFSAGMAAYRARNYAEATRQFDVPARNGDQNAALWAAQSVRDGAGCGAALARFESVAQHAAGTPQGNNALLEAAKCQISLGQLDAARDKLNRLSSVPSHAALAQQALSELNQQVASRRAAGTSRGGSASPKAAAPAPARPSSPATTESY